MPESDQSFSPRHATVERRTSETHVSLEFNLDGSGRYVHDTGIGFLNHMLDLFARHGRFDLNVTCRGDLHVDDHHTAEDVGIVLGTAFKQALGDKKFITRYGHAYVPMDDVLARVVVDLSGRFYLHFGAEFSREKVGDLSTELVSHFWYSFAEAAACNLHIDVLHGRNTHHQIEAIFKAAGRALRVAVSREAANDPLPSTKGVL